jgi:hypothetical protein
MLDKILYTDSGTGQTQDMLKVLMDVPAIKKAALTILHVIPPLASADALTAKWEEGGKIIANILENAQLDPNKVSTMLRQGEPKDVVCQVAEEI